MGLKPENVPQLTLNNGMKIPCIGLGTFGSDRVSAADVANAVGGAIRCGYRLIDCAACYGNEKEIGGVIIWIFSLSTGRSPIIMLPGVMLIPEILIPSLFPLLNLWIPIVRLKLWSERAK